MGPVLAGDCGPRANRSIRKAAVDRSRREWITESSNGVQVAGLTQRRTVERRELLRRCPQLLLLRKLVVVSLHAGCDKPGQWLRSRRRPIEPCATRASRLCRRLGSCKVPRANVGVVGECPFAAERGIAAEMCRRVGRVWNGAGTNRAGTRGIVYYPPPFILGGSQSWCSMGASTGDSMGLEGTQGPGRLGNLLISLIFWTGC